MYSIIVPWLTPSWWIKQNVQQRMEDWKQRCNILMEQIYAVDPYYVPTNEYRFIDQASYADIAAGRTSPSSRNCSPYRQQEDAISPATATQVLRPIVTRSQKISVDYSSNNQQQVTKIQTQENEMNLNKLLLESESEIETHTHSAEDQIRTNVDKNQQTVPKIIETSIRRGRSPIRKNLIKIKDSRSITLQETEDNTQSNVNARQKTPTKNMLELREERRGRSPSPMWIPGSISYADILRRNAQTSLQANLVATLELPKQKMTSLSGESHDPIKLSHTELIPDTVNINRNVNESEDQQAVSNPEIQVQEAERITEAYCQSSNITADKMNRENYVKSEANWTDKILENYNQVLHTEAYDNILEQSHPTEIYEYIISEPMPEVMGFIESQLGTYPMDSYVYVPSGHHQEVQQLETMNINPYNDGSLTYSSEHYVAQTGYLTATNIYQQTAIQQQQCPTSDLKQTSSISMEESMENPIEMPIAAHSDSTITTQSTDKFEHKKPMNISDIETPIASQIEEKNTSPSNNNENKEQTFSYAQILSQGLSPRVTPTRVISKSPVVDQQCKECSYSSKDSLSSHELSPLQETKFSPPLQAQVSRSERSRHFDDWDTMKKQENKQKQRMNNKSNQIEESESPKFIGESKQKKELHKEKQSTETKDKSVTHESCKNNLSDVEKDIQQDEQAVNLLDIVPQEKKRKRKKKKTDKSTGDEVDKALKEIEDMEKQKMKFQKDKSKEQNKSRDPANETLKKSKYKSQKQEDQDEKSRKSKKSKDKEVTNTPLKLKENLTATPVISSSKIEERDFQSFSKDNIEAKKDIKDMKDLLTKSEEMHKDTSEKLKDQSQHDLNKFNTKEKHKNKTDRDTKAKEQSEKSSKYKNREKIRISTDDNKDKSPIIQKTEFEDIKENPSIFTKTEIIEEQKIVRKQKESSKNNTGMTEEKLEIKDNKKNQGKHENDIKDIISTNQYLESTKLSNNEEQECDQIDTKLKTENITDQTPVTEKQTNISDTEMTEKHQGKTRKQKRSKNHTKQGKLITQNEDKIRKDETEISRSVKRENDEYDIKSQSLNESTAGTFIHEQFVGETNLTNKQNASTSDERKTKATIKTDKCITETPSKSKKKGKLKEKIAIHPIVHNAESTETSKSKDVVEIATAQSEIVELIAPAEENISYNRNPEHRNNVIKSETVETAKISETELTIPTNISGDIPKIVSSSETLSEISEVYPKISDATDNNVECTEEKELLARNGEEIETDIKCQEKNIFTNNLEEKQDAVLQIDPRTNQLDTKSKKSDTDQYLSVKVKNDKATTMAKELLKNTVAEEESNVKRRNDSFDDVHIDRKYEKDEITMSKGVKDNLPSEQLSATGKALIIEKIITTVTTTTTSIPGRVRVKPPDVKSVKSVEILESIPLPKIIGSKTTELITLRPETIEASLTTTYARLPNDSFINNNCRAQSNQTVNFPKIDLTLPAISNEDVSTDEQIVFTSIEDRAGSCSEIEVSAINCRNKEARAQLMSDYLLDFVNPYVLDQHAYKQAESDFYRYFKVIKVVEPSQSSVSIVPSRPVKNIESIVRESVMRPTEQINRETFEINSCKRHALIMETPRYPITSFNEFESQWVKAKSVNEEFLSTTSFDNLETLAESLNEKRTSTIEEKEIINTTFDITENTNVINVEKLKTETDKDLILHMPQATTTIAQTAVSNMVNSLNNDDKNTDPKDVQQNIHLTFDDSWMSILDEAIIIEDEFDDAPTPSEQVTSIETTEFIESPIETVVDNINVRNTKNEIDNEKARDQCKKKKESKYIKDGKTKRSKLDSRKENNIKMSVANFESESSAERRNLERIELSQIDADSKTDITTATMDEQLQAESFKHHVKSNLPINEDTLQEKAQNVVDKTHGRQFPKHEESKSKSSEKAEKQSGKSEDIQEKSSKRDDKITKNVQKQRKSKDDASRYNSRLNPDAISETDSSCDQLSIVLSQSITDNITNITEQSPALIEQNENETIIQSTKEQTSKNTEETKVAMNDDIVESLIEKSLEESPKQFKEENKSYAQVAASCRIFPQTPQEEICLTKSISSKSDHEVPDMNIAAFEEINENFDTEKLQNSVEQINKSLSNNETDITKFTQKESVPWIEEMEEEALIVSPNSDDDIDLKDNETCLKSETSTWAAIVGKKSVESGSGLSNISSKEKSLLQKPDQIIDQRPPAQVQIYVEENLEYEPVKNLIHVDEQGFMEYINRRELRSRRSRSRSRSVKRDNEHVITKIPCLNKAKTEDKTADTVTVSNEDIKIKNEENIKTPNKQLDQKNIEELEGVKEITVSSEKENISKSKDKIKSKKDLNEHKQETKKQITETCVRNNDNKIIQGINLEQDEISKGKKSKTKNRRDQMTKQQISLKEQKKLEDVNKLVKGDEKSANVSETTNEMPSDTESTSIIKKTQLIKDIESKEENKLKGVEVSITKQDNIVKSKKKSKTKKKRNVFEKDIENASDIDKQTIIAVDHVNLEEKIEPRTEIKLDDEASVKLKGEITEYIIESAISNIEEDPIRKINEQENIEHKTIIDEMTKQESIKQEIIDELKSVETQELHGRAIEENITKQRKIHTLTKAEKQKQKKQAKVSSQNITEITDEKQAESIEEDVASNKITELLSNDKNHTKNVKDLEEVTKVKEEGVILVSCEDNIEITCELMKNDKSTIEIQSVEMEDTEKADAVSENGMCSSQITPANKQDYKAKVKTKKRKHKQDDGNKSRNLSSSMADSKKIETASILANTDICDITLINEEDINDRRLDDERSEVSQSPQDITHKNYLSNITMQGNINETGLPVSPIEKEITAESVEIKESPSSGKKNKQKQKLSKKQNAKTENRKNTQQVEDKDIVEKHISVVNQTLCTISEKIDCKKQLSEISLKESETNSQLEILEKPVTFIEDVQIVDKKDFCKPEEIASNDTTINTESILILNNVETNNIADEFETNVLESNKDTNNETLLSNNCISTVVKHVLPSDKLSSIVQQSCEEEEDKLQHIASIEEEKGNNLEPPIESPKSKVQFYLADEIIVLNPNSRRLDISPSSFPQKQPSDLPGSQFLSIDGGFWPDKRHYHEAERDHFENLALKKDLARSSKRNSDNNRFDRRDHDDDYDDNHSGGSGGRSRDSHGNSCSFVSTPQTEHMIADLPGGICSWSDYSTYLSSENERTPDHNTDLSLGTIENSMIDSDLSLSSDTIQPANFFPFASLFHHPQIQSYIEPVVKNTRINPKEYPTAASSSTNLLISDRPGICTWPSTFAHFTPQSKLHLGREMGEESIQRCSPIGEVEREMVNDEAESRILRIQVRSRHTQCSVLFYRVFFFFYQIHCHNMRIYIYHMYILFVFDYLDCLSLVFSLSLSLILYNQNILFSFSLFSRLSPMCAIF